jgi:hypothetical protein
MSEHDPLATEPDPAPAAEPDATATATDTQVTGTASTSQTTEPHAANTPVLAGTAAWTASSSQGTIETAASAGTAALTAPTSRSTTETATPAGEAGPTSQGTTDPTAPVDRAGAAGDQVNAAGIRPATPDDAWAHFAPAPERRPGWFGRQFGRVGRVLRHEWTLASLGALTLAVLMHWDSIRHPGTTIPADIWDPTLQAWQMAWAGHALLHDPLQLWHANAFYPDLYSYTFSDTLFGYAPAGMIGTGPTAGLIRYNIMFVLLHALAFLGPYALVRQLGAGRTAAAVAGVAFAYAPWRWGQAGHMHVLSNGGIALALALLARGHGYSFTQGFQRDRVRPRWIFAGWVVAAWQISLGFGIGIPFAYILGGMCLVAGVVWLIRAIRRRPVPGLWALLSNGAGVLLFLGVAGLMARPYLEVVKLHPEAKRSVEDLRAFSPTIRAFITAPAQSLPWGSAHEAARSAMSAPAETTLLPGFMLIGLAVAGLFFSIWSLRVRLGLFLATVVSVVFAMGTEFFGGTVTYVPLFTYAPGWEAIRTPGRLVLWTTLLLAVLAAGAVGGLVQRSYELAAERVPNRPGLLTRWATLLPLVLVLAEGTNQVDHPVVPPQPAALRAASGPLLVLPSCQLVDERVMLWSTGTFPKIVNGGSGFTPDDQSQTREVAKSFPDQASVDYLRRLGVRTVIVLKADTFSYDECGAPAYPDPPVDELGMSRVDDGETIVYTLR